MILKKIILVIIGTLALSIGAIGIFVPVLPTTPFVLLAAICFGSSNKRLSTWLENTKIFGEYIKNYRNKTGVSRQTKIKSLIFVWLSLSVSAFFMQKMMLWGILLIAGICVSIHIMLLKESKI